MKKLLVITENYARGGGNRYLVDVINAVANDFSDITLVSNHGAIFTEDKARLSRPITHLGFLFITRAWINQSLLSFSRGVRRAIVIPTVFLEPLFFIYHLGFSIAILRKTRPTCVLSCNGGYPASIACLAMVIAAKWLKLPVVLSIVSLPLPRRRHLWLYEFTVDRLVWQSVSTVLVNAQAIASALCQLRGLPDHKIKIVYNGLEDSTCVRSYASKEEILIGCIARMEAAKGVLYLLDAFADLAREHLELRLVLVGQGDASDELQRRVAAYGLQQRVSLLGHYQGDITSILNSIDIYVFPSLWEGFPYSIVEALRAACTIVATKVGGIPEVIDNDGDGLLIAPGSKEEIVSAIESLLSHPEVRYELSRNARKRFEKDLSLEKMHANIRSIFSSISNAT